MPRTDWERVAATGTVAGVIVTAANIGTTGYLLLKASRENAELRSKLGKLQREVDGLPAEHQKKALNGIRKGRATVTFRS